MKKYMEEKRMRNEKVQGWESLKQNQKKGCRDRKDNCGFNCCRIDDPFLLLEEGKGAKLVKDLSFNCLTCSIFKNIFLSV